MEAVRVAIRVRPLNERCVTRSSGFASVSA